MKKAARMMLLFVNAVLCMVLVLVRQYGHMSFIKLQEIEHQQKIEQHLLNQKHIEYLKVAMDVPNRATEQDYIIKDR